MIYSMSEATQLCVTCMWPPATSHQCIPADSMLDGSVYLLYSVTVLGHSWIAIHLSVGAGSPGASIHIALSLSMQL